MACRACRYCAASGFFAVIMAGGVFINNLAFLLSQDVFLHQGFAMNVRGANTVYQGYLLEVDRSISICKLWSVACALSWL